MRFLGLQLEDRVTDAKTVWLYRERLKALNLVGVLFARFHEQLAAQGYVARAGRRHLRGSPASAQQPGREREDQGR
jgi:hypothetical protein